MASMTGGGLGYGATSHFSAGGHPAQWIKVTKRESTSVTRGGKKLKTGTIVGYQPSKAVNLQAVTMPKWAGNYNGCLPWYI